MRQDEISDTFAGNLQRLRKKKDLTQQEISVLLSVPRSRVGSWEEQRAFPCIADLLRICKIFSVSIEQITTTKCN